MSRLLISSALLAAFSVLCVFSSDLDVSQLKAQLPPELANSNFTLDDAKNLLRYKCSKSLPTIEAAESAYQDIENGTTVLTECLSALLNVTAMQTEIEIAKPIGELDTVFVKYCSKRPQAVKCIEDFNEVVLPCLDKEEKAANVVLMRVINSIFNFVCYKGGDQIALFYAEKGPECLEENKEEISECLNNTLGAYIAKNGVPEITNTLPQLVIGPKQCSDVAKLETCIVSALETCEEITPSNIAESMFRFVRNETQCPSVSANPKEARKSGSSALSVVSAFGVLSVALLQKFVF